MLRVKSVCVIAFCISTPVIANEYESAAEFFRKDQMGFRQTQLFAPRAKSHLIQKIRSEARSQLGWGWGDVAVRIAKLESGFRCRAIGPATKYGKAMGIMQVLPSTARGLGVRGSLLRCDTGIRAGIAHMRDCINKGATKTSLMLRCYLGGPGAIHRRQRRSAENYHRYYSATYRKISLPQGASCFLGLFCR